MLCLEEVVLMAQRPLVEADFAREEGGARRRVPESDDLFVRQAATPYAVAYLPRVDPLASQQLALTRGDILVEDMH